MLFGSISNIFGVVEGSVAAIGDTIGGVAGTGAGSAMGIAETVIQTIYSASAQPIPTL